MANATRFKECHYYLSLCAPKTHVTAQTDELSELVRKRRQLSRC
jgi:hypothetical protein